MLHVHLFCVHLSLSVCSSVCPLHFNVSLLMLQEATGSKHHTKDNIVSVNSPLPGVDNKRAAVAPYSHSLIHC